MPPLKILRNLSLTGAAAFGLLTLTQCQLSDTSGSTEIQRAQPAGDSELFPTPLALNVPSQSAALNDVARVLAGLPALTGQNAFAEVRERPAWRSHAQSMNGLFNEFSARHGHPVAAWAGTHLGKLQGANSVFYPFSGPDFLFAHLFFPNAETYLMCGLEGCEPLPEWKTLSEGDVNSGLQGLVGGLDNLLQYSYFITKEMRQDFQATRFRGVLPVFLVFLARTGHVVESINAVRLDGSGSPVILPAAQATVPGLLIRFRGASGQSKRLFYFTQDLGDGACRRDGPFLRFAASLGRPAAFAKSASYLMHEPYFSNVREFIFSRSIGIVQDPSGIPYREFATHGWRTQLYGNYQRTLDIFQEYEQTDLRSAYLNPDNGAQPINFGIGYLTLPSTTSLMVATPR